MMVTMRIVLMIAYMMMPRMAVELLLMLMLVMVLMMTLTRLPMQDDCDSYDGCGRPWA